MRIPRKISNALWASFLKSTRARDIPTTPQLRSMSICKWLTLLWILLVCYMCNFTFHLSEHLSSCLHLSVIPMGNPNRAVGPYIRSILKLHPPLTSAAFPQYWQCIFSLNSYRWFLDFIILQGGDNCASISVSLTSLYFSQSESGMSLHCGIIVLICRLDLWYACWGKILAWSNSSERIPCVSCRWCGFTRVSFFLFFRVAQL